jgi:phage terminase large subunit-like protein
VRRAILSVARKNGKTGLIAALMLVHLIGPESMENNEVYSIANDREQAALVYKVASQMVQMDSELSEVLRCVDSTKTIFCPSNQSRYQAKSAESGTKHGLNPSFVCYDELAQAKNRTLYDVMDTSFGARTEPLFVVISTQSNDPKHILSELIDDGLNAADPRIVCHLYEVPMDCKDVFDPHVWKQANPALGDFLSFENLKAEADKARRMPAEEPRFRNLRLNQRVSPISTLIARAEWEACVGPAAFQPGEDVYLALDLSAKLDLTALVMGSCGEKTRIRPFLWKPEDTLRAHADRDFGSGNRRYEQWVREGHLLISPGSTIDGTVVALKIIELCQTYNVLGLAYDRWHMDVVAKELDAMEFQCWEDSASERRTGSGLRLVPWGQGYKDMGMAINALEAEVTARTLEHANNPALNWNVSNAVASMNPAGERRLEKAKARFRIDGAVALAMVCGLKARDRKSVVNVAAMIG